MSARLSDLKLGIRELSFPFMQEPTEKQPLQAVDSNLAAVRTCDHVNTDID